MRARCRSDAEQGCPKQVGCEARITMLRHIVLLCDSASIKALCALARIGIDQVGAFVRSTDGMPQCTAVSALDVAWIGGTLIDFDACKNRICIP